MLFSFKSSTIGILVTLTAISIVPLPANADSIQYTVTELSSTVPGFDSFLPMSINNQGDIVGFTTKISDQTTHVFLFHDGISQDLGIVSETYDNVLKINNTRQIIFNNGTFPSRHAYLWNNGVKTDLGSLGSSDTVVADINDSGQIVGMSGNSPFLYSNGIMSNLNQSGFHGLPTAINNNGQIAGTNDHNDHAILFSQGIETDLGTLGGNFSNAKALNNLGHVTGDSAVGTDVSHPFFTDQNGIHDLWSLSGQVGYANDINNSDTIVGMLYLSTGLPKGFVFSQGQVMDLNTLIDPALAWSIQWAGSINDSGQIVAQSFVRQHTQYGHALLLTPNTAATGIPAAPAYLTAHAVSGFDIDLLWAPVPEATSYSILRSATPGGPYTSVGTISNSTNYRDSGLQITTSYYYRVRANNRFGAGISSTEATATTKSGIPDQAPYITVYPSGRSQISVIWGDRAVPGATSYQVFRGTTQGGYHTYIGSTDQTYFIDPARQPGVTYYYIVRAVNSYGQGPKSNETSAVTTGLPNAPGNLTAIPSSKSQINLTWTAADGAATYTIYRSTTPGGPGRVIIGNTTGTSFNDTSLKATTTYYYVVVAGNNYGWTKSQEVSAVTLGLPGTLSNLKVTAISKTQINLTWTGASDTTSYTIYRSTTPDGPGRVIIGQTTSATSFSDTHVQTATRYYYVVVAGNSYGYTKSSEVSARTIGLPDAPTGLAAAPMLVAAPGTSQVWIGWQPADGATSYTIYRSTTSGTGRVIIGQTTNAASFIDTHIQFNTTYYYVVVAGNAEGWTKSAELRTNIGTP